MPVRKLDHARTAGAHGPGVRRGAAARSLLLIVTLGVLIALSAWSMASALPGSRAATNGAQRDAAVADDDAGTALFQLTALVPGETQTRCITVSHDGPTPDGIRLTGSADGGDLRQFLRFSVEKGSGGHFGDCSGFAGTQVFEGSLAEFVGLHHDYESGLVTLTPTQPGSTTFRLRVTLDDVAAAQGKTATASFAWEARSGAINVEPSAPADEPAAEPKPEPAPEPEPELPSTEDSPSRTPTPSTPDAVDRSSRDTPDGAPLHRPTAPAAPAKALRPAVRSPPARRRARWRTHPRQTRECQRDATRARRRAVASAPFRRQPPLRRRPPHGDPRPRPSLIPCWMRSPRSRCRWHIGAPSRWSCSSSPGCSCCFRTASIAAIPSSRRRRCTRNQTCPSCPHPSRETPVHEP